MISQQKINRMKKLLPGLFVPASKKEMNTLAEEVHEALAKTDMESNERAFTTVDLWSIQRRKKRIALRRAAYSGI
jgi:hypothetical protein